MAIDAPAGNPSTRRAARRALRQHQVTAALVSAELPAVPAPAASHWDDLFALAASLHDIATGPTAFEAIAPASRMYLDAIAHGPGTVPLRAAYQLGRAHARLVARAKGTESGQVQAPAVARATEIAVAAFAIVDELAARDPALEDATTAPLIASARSALGRP